MSASNDATSHTPVYPSFIDSTPLGEDLFEGRSQEQIAASVSELIRSNRTENRLIGFDGAWGSGKSNLIKIIARKLQDSHHVFTYDAWGHQEDLQRRAFLEELTAALCNASIIDRSEWTAKLKHLLAKQRETVTKTIPRLSYGVVLTILVAIFTPIMETIADGIEHELAQVLVTASPLLIGIIIYIGASIRSRHLLTLSEVYAFYKEQDLTNESHVTISENEPSVKQFQAWMADLSQALTSKQLIIVFDNMDRLPSDKVRELWSSIHTFFAEQSFGGIWVIVPFDREHLATVFGNDKAISDQFLKKSFSVIYRISPPVLTDWQRFYELKYHDAFGDTENDELHTTRRVLDVLEPQITPRGIISYINEMVSIRLIVEEDILLRYIALFVLTKEQILTDPVNQILSLEFLKGASSLFRDDRELPNQIAALVYNVPLASASQVTLTREIEKALTDSNRRRLEELTKHPHFVDILEQVIASENVAVPNSVMTIAELDTEKLEGKAVKERMKGIWDVLCARELMNPIKEQRLSDTHKRLLSNVSPEPAKALVRYIVVGLRNVEQFNGTHYYNALADLREHVQSLGLTIDVSEISTVLRKPPDTFVAYLSAAEEDYRAFKLTCDESELHEFVMSRVPNKLHGLDVLRFVRDEFNLKPIREKLEAALPENNIEHGAVIPFYNLYKGIVTEKPIKPIEDGHINTLLTQVGNDTETQLELLTMRIARANTFPESGGAAKTILSETNEDRIAQIARNIEYYANYGDLLIRYVSWPQPVLKGVLRNLTLNTYGSSRLNITKVLKHFGTLCASLEIAPKDFISRLNPWEGYAREQISSKNIVEAIPDPVFFENAVDTDCELANYLVNEMVVYLESLAVEEWRDALRHADSYLFNVTHWLLGDGRLRYLPDDAVSVYKELLVEVAKGEFEMSAEEAWDVLYDRTHKSKLKATAKNVRDLLLSDCTITPAIFKSLADLLLNHGALPERSADVSRRILAPVVIDDECRAYVVEHRAVLEPIINAAGDDASDFRDVIRQKALLSDASSELIEFAKSIGIEGVEGEESASAD